MKHITYVVDFWKLLWYKVFKHFVAQIGQPDPPFDIHFADVFASHSPDHFCPSIAFSADSRSLTSSDRAAT